MHGLVRRRRGYHKATEEMQDLYFLYQLKSKGARNRFFHFQHQLTEKQSLFHLCRIVPHTRVTQRLRRR